MTSFVSGAMIAAGAPPAPNSSGRPSWRDRIRCRYRILANRRLQRKLGNPALEPVGKALEKLTPFFKGHLEATDAAQEAERRETVAAE